jgi:hypothetical protein
VYRKVSGLTIRYPHTYKFSKNWLSNDNHSRRKWFRLEPDMPRTTFREMTFFRRGQLRNHGFHSIALPIELSHQKCERDSNPQLACCSVQLSYPCKGKEKDSNLRPTRCGKQHRAKQHVIPNFNTTLWHHTEMLIRSCLLFLSGSKLPVNCAVFLRSKYFFRFLLKNSPCLLIEML